MVIKYQKSSYYEEYFVITFTTTIKDDNEPPIEKEVILDFNQVLWRFGLYTSEFIKKMKLFNAVEYDDIEYKGIMYINYLFFKKEEDILNAIDYLNSLIIMDKLNNTIQHN